jgi:hypothetical protein
MEIVIPLSLPKSVRITQHNFNKMKFIMTALDNGWTVKKNSDTYVFSKKHEEKEEVFKNDYLEKFVQTNAVSLLD